MIARVMSAAFAALLATAAPAASTPSEVSLTRLDCGTVQVNDLNAFSDTLAYTGRSRTLTNSCYLIRHGDDYLLWDTGLPAAMKGAPVDRTSAMSPTLSRTLAEQLAELGVKPEQIRTVGISHYHFDHIGQAALFPQATLLIGSADWKAVNDGSAGGFSDPTLLAPWVKGGARVDAVTGDRDLFGDGSVVMLDMSGHTPGHHALLVRLKDAGPVLLTGDLAHFTENYATNGVPGFNTNRADTLASLDRFKAMAANLKATVIIQHEPADIAKLPAFPKAAR